MTQFFAGRGRYYLKLYEDDLLTVVKERNEEYGKVFFIQKLVYVKNWFWKDLTIVIIILKKDISIYMFLNVVRNDW